MPLNHRVTQHHLKVHVHRNSRSVVLTTIVAFARDPSCVQCITLIESLMTMMKYDE
jgi:hypothetical protein